MTNAVLASHLCSAYCADPEHCELVYVSPGVTEADLQTSYALAGIWLRDITPAPEAPPVEQIASRVNLTGRGLGTEPRLVWFNAHICLEEPHG